MTHFYNNIDCAHTHLATWFYHRGGRCLLVSFDTALRPWMDRASARAVMDDFGNLVKVSA